MIREEYITNLPFISEIKDKKDPMCHMRFYCSWNGWVWYVMSYNPKAESFYGYIIKSTPSLDFFSLTELNSIHGPGGEPISIDKTWKPKKLSEVQGTSMLSMES